MSKIAALKTKQTASNVDDFINTVNDQEKRKDSFILLKLMQRATNEEPKMWGSSLIGFGMKRYKSPATGREVDWFKIGFSPRKTNLSLHLSMDIQQHAALLKKLGKHKTGVGCLYVSRLADIDVKVLEEIIYAAANMK